MTCNADKEFPGIFCRIFGPVDKQAEVIKERGLHAVFAWGGPHGLGDACRQAEGYQYGRGEKFQETFHNG